MTTPQQRYIFFGAILLVLAILGWQGWVFFEKGRESKMVGEELDPFSGLTIPEKYLADTATKKVIEDKIAATKVMYAEKPKIWETWIAIGNLRALLEDYKGAIRAYEQSIALQPNNILGYRNIAEIYNQHLKDYKRTAEYYKLALENEFNNAELYTALAFVYYKQLGNNEEAEKIYIEGLRRTSFDSSILTALIQFYKDTGNTEKYIENVRLLIERNPDNTFYRDTYGKALRAIGVTL